MDASNQPLSNTALLSAIRRMQQEGSRESRQAVLDLVISSARFLAPVTILTNAKDTYGEDTAIQFQLLQNQSGQPFFPAFTGWEELRKLCGPKNQQTLVLSFDDYARMILRDNRAAGLVLDPFGACLSFERDMMAHLAQRRQEQL